MKMVKSLLLGSAAGLVAVAGAQAAGVAPLAASTGSVKYLFQLPNEGGLDVVRRVFGVRENASAICATPGRKDSFEPVIRRFFRCLCRSLD